MRITDPVTSPSVTVGTAVAFAATTADAGGDAVTCAITWGEGSQTVGCAGSHAWSTAGTYTVTITATDDDGASGSATRQVTVTAPTPTFHFDGFYAPVDNLPVVNVVKAGSVVPLKFSLGGNFGLGIFAAGYPASAWRSCTGAPTDALEETVQPGAATLTYDPASGRYHYNWQTQKGWAGTCRTLVLRFVDGTQVTAEFRFK